MDWSYFTNQIPELVDHLVVELPWLEIQLENSVASRSRVLDAWNGWDLHKNPKNHLHLKAFGWFCLHSFVTDTPKSCKKNQRPPRWSKLSMEWSKRNPSWLSSLLLGRFYAKNVGLSDISPQGIWKVLRLRVPKKPKRVIEVRSDKIAELFFARTPTKKKRLGKSIHYFFHTDLHLWFYLQLCKNHLKILKNNGFWLGFPGTVGMDIGWIDRFAQLACQRPCGADYRVMWVDWFTPGCGFISMVFLLGT